MSMLFVYCATFLQLVAESFPVSSSGHLSLLDCVWSKVVAITPEYACSFPWTDTIFWERYVDLLHCVPLVIIAWYFYPRWRIFLMHPLRTWRSALKLIGYGVLADGVTAVLYFARGHSSFFVIPLWIGFTATALLLMSLLFIPVGNARLTWWRAALLGLFQGLALLPGLSRFAATFCGARFLGFSSRSSFELSFMLQWPLIVAAVTRSVFFFTHYQATASVVTPVLVSVLLGSALLAWFGFLCAARLAHTERLWYCAVYVAAVAVVAGIVAC